VLVLSRRLQSSSGCSDSNVEYAASATTAAGTAVAAAVTVHRAAMMCCGGYDMVRPRLMFYMALIAYRGK